MGATNRPDVGTFLEARTAWSARPAALAMAMAMAVAVAACTDEGGGVDPAGDTGEDPGGDTVAVDAADAWAADGGADTLDVADDSGTPDVPNDTGPGDGGEDSGVSDAADDTGTSDIGGDAGPDAPEADVPEPTGPPQCPQLSITSPPVELGLDPHYTRWVDVGGVPLVGSDLVPDDAFRRAYYIVANMMRGRPCERLALAESGTRIGLIAVSELTTDMPEYADLYEAFPGTDWNVRARGLGATLVRPLTSGAEENLLEYPADKWPGEIIMLHEFAHTWWNFGVRALAGGDEAQGELQAAYSAALADGLFTDTYAASHVAEYWAEGVQSWFGDNIEKDPPNGIHNHVNTRAELEAYDPTLAALIAAHFDPTPWPVRCDLTGAGPTWEDPLAELPPDVGAECEVVDRYPPSLDCADEVVLMSGADDVPSQLTVVNRTFDTTLDLYRLDTEGQRVLQKSLLPRRTWTAGTFEGHAWVAATEDGTCVGLWSAGPHHTHAVVE